jgi:hypothetical protein
MEKRMKPQETCKECGKVKVLHCEYVVDIYDHSTNSYTVERHYKTYKCWHTEIIDICELLHQRD